MESLSLKRLNAAAPREISPDSTATRIFSLIPLVSGDNCRPGLLREEDQSQSHRITFPSLGLILPFFPRPFFPSQYRSGGAALRMTDHGGR